MSRRGGGPCRFCGEPTGHRYRVCAKCRPRWQRRKQEKRDRKKAYSRIAFEHGEECFICGRAPVTRRLNVDHDHKTGRIRGLLCFFCNYGLAMFKDSPSRLERAAEYLRNPIDFSLPQEPPNEVQ